MAHAANKHGTKGLITVAARYASLEAFSGEAGYPGAAVEFVETVLRLKPHISEKIKDWGILTTSAENGLQSL